MLGSGRAGTLTLALVAMLALAAGAAQAGAGSALAGTPGVMTATVPGGRASIAALAAAGRGSIPDEPGEGNEVEQPDRSGLPQDPLSPSAAAWPAPGAGPAHAASTAAAVRRLGLSFTAATSRGANPTFSYPPDCMGAVGPTQFVVAVNNRIVTFDRASGAADGVLNTTTNTFFSPVLDSTVAGGATTSDPRIRYDRLTGRWFLTIITLARPNRILLAVSDGQGQGALTPASTFTYYHLDLTGNCFADYPTLAVDANALYVGVNVFCSGVFSGSEGYVIRKSSVLGAGPMVATLFAALSTGTAGMFTPQGTDDVDPGATEGWFVGVDVATFGRLQFRRVSDPGGTPTLSAMLRLAVLTTSIPLKVDHLGNLNGPLGRLDGIDDRLLTACVRDGHLWASHNVSVDNMGVASATRTRDGARWYELRVPPVTGTPTVEQEGTVFAASPQNTTDQRSEWMSSLMVTGQGHVAMGFSTAGSQEHVNAAFAARLATDPHGSMQDPVALTASASAYNPGSSRWGDYSYTSLDPLDDMTLWTVQQFCDTTDSYGVRVAQLLAPPPAAPSALADVPAGGPSVQVALTGSSSGAEGFYDPGPDLPGVPPFHHLTVAISGSGVSGTPPQVVSATYVDPTTIALVLDASHATANAGSERYTLTVTNPDGQSSAAAVVHVVGIPTITAWAGSGHFAPPAAVAAGVQPGAVAVADLDGDGRPDLAIANRGEHSITLWRGDGAGGFGARSDLDVGATPWAVAIADLDADGRADLVVSTRAPDGLIVLPGTGAGGFGAGTSVPAGALPGALAIADVNGDGRPDVLICDEGADSVSVLPGTASGLGARTAFATGVRPDALAVGDLDGDGQPDLAIADWADGTLSVLRGGGGGTFGARTMLAVGAKPVGVTMADLNGDGRLDLVAADDGDDAVSVLIGTGGGAFKGATAFACGRQPAALAAADLDGDGVPDVAVADFSAGTLTILTGSGTGDLISRSDLPVGGGPVALAVADLDLDGTADLVVADRADGAAAVLAGLGGSISPPGTTLHGLGTNAAYSIAPSSGYFTYDVKVDGLSQGPLAAYSFSSLSSSHRISAAFRQGVLGVGGPAGDGPEFAAPVVFPNPAPGSATLALTLRAPGRLRVGIYDLGGRLVRTLADDTRAEAGTHRFALRTGPGTPLRAGLYFYRVELDSGGARGRFVVLE